jgi:hypothetical protein
MRGATREQRQQDVAAANWQQDLEAARRSDDPQEIEQVRRQMSDRGLGEDGYPADH